MTGIIFHSEVRPLRRYHKLPFGYAVSFEWNTAKQRVDVNWSELPCIRSKKAQRRFFEACARVRTEFLTEVAHITGSRSSSPIPRWTGSRRSSGQRCSDDRSHPD